MLKEIYSLHQVTTDLHLMDGENAIIFDQLVNGILEALSIMFLCIVEKRLGSARKFLKLAALAMKQLALNGCSNVLYNMAKVIGTIRNDNSVSCFPERMPMGLIEYACNFFTSENMNKV